MRLQSVCVCVVEKKMCRKCVNFFYSVVVVVDDVDGGNKHAVPEKKIQNKTNSSNEPKKYSKWCKATALAAFNSIVNCHLLLSHDLFLFFSLFLSLFLTHSNTSIVIRTPLLSKFKYISEQFVAWLNVIWFGKLCRSIEFNCVLISATVGQREKNEMKCNWKKTPYFVIKRKCVCARDRNAKKLGHANQCSIMGRELIFFKRGFTNHIDIAYRWAIIHGMDIIIFNCAQNYYYGSVVLAAFKCVGEWENAWTTNTAFDNDDNDDDLFHQFACRQNTTPNLKSTLCNRMWIVVDVVGHVGQRLFSLLKWI